jgi:hypothetical protein
MKLRWILGVLFGAVGSVVHAQVVYTVNGGTPTALPANNTIVLTDPVSTDTLIHIYDSSGMDDSITGQLVIKGEGGGGLLKVQVASQGEGDVFLFPQQPTREIVFGLRNFGGLRFEHPTDPNDTSLRDNSIVAVAVQGDITGDIEAGQVWRIDALQSQNGTFGGTISGNIKSHQSPGGSGIRVVRAGRELSGNVEAVVGRIQRGRGIEVPHRATEVGLATSVHSKCDRLRLRASRKRGIEVPPLTPCH